MKSDHPKCNFKLKHNKHLMFECISCHNVYAFCYVYWIFEYDTSIDILRINSLKYLISECDKESYGFQLNTSIADGMNSNESCFFVKLF